MTEREFRRWKQKTETEAKKYLAALMVRFLEWTQGEDDLDSQEMAQKIDNFEITWKVYCRRHKLTQESQGVFREHAVKALLEMQAVVAQQLRNAELLEGDSLPQKNEGLSNSDL